METQEQNIGRLFYYNDCFVIKNNILVPRQFSFNPCTPSSASLETLKEVILDDVSTTEKNNSISNEILKLKEQKSIEDDSGIFFYSVLNFLYFL